MRYVRAYLTEPDGGVQMWHRFIGEDLENESVNKILDTYLEFTEGPNSPPKDPNVDSIPIGFKVNVNDLLKQFIIPYYGAYRHTETIGLKKESILDRVRKLNQVISILKHIGFAPMWIRNFIEFPYAQDTLVVEVANWEEN